MKNYIINDLDDNTMNGGRKARNDVFTFAKQDGFKEILLPFIIHPQDRSFKAKLQKLKYSKITIPKLLKNANDADVIVFQYPMYSTFLMNHLIEDIKKYTHAKLVYVIHDIEGIRMFDDTDNYSDNELRLLKQADGIIAHNQPMTDWLKEHGITVPIVNLGIFDYQNPQLINQDMDYNKSVVFAGSLEKSTFLTKLNLKDTKLTLYGPNPADQYPACIQYEGKLSPEELPKRLTQNFGLVWDGDELDTCSGTYGHYLQFNAPHKTSLYLSSGIPVIIWKKAAMAKFIEENHVGLAIDNLNDLDDVLAQITDDEYKTIKQNAINMAMRLREGHYTKAALDQIVKQVM
ncbi:MAG TPA: sugar transferase [Ligilactobacillus aviarius]|nr:sugar transferase [Ligilactobacillus aviarius]